MLKQLRSYGFRKQILLSVLVLLLSVLNLYLSKPKTATPAPAELPSKVSLSLSSNEANTATESSSVLSHSYSYSRIVISGGQYPSGSGGVISLASTGEPTIDISSYEVSGEAKLRVYNASLTDLLNYLVHNKEGNQINKDINLSNFQFVGETNANISSESTSVSIPITDSGIWLVNVSLGGREVKAFVIRSKFGVFAKEGDNELIYWGQDFNSLRKITNGNVKTYKLLDGATELASSDFDSEGIARTPIGGDIDVAVAERDGSIALIPLNLQYLNYGFSYQSFTPKDRIAKFFAFTDRPLYQPGDKVYFKTVIRDDDDARYSIPSGVVKVKAGQDYSRNDDSDAIFLKNFPITSDGTVYGEFTIPADAKTGYYNLTFDLAPGSSSYSLYGSAYFQVEFFRKPEYHIEIDASKTEFINGDGAEVTIRGNYFFGQPITKQNVKYKVYNSPMYEYYYYQSESYSLNDDYRYGSYYASPIKEGELAFDNKGEAKLDITLDAADAESRSQVYSIEAEFDDGSGNPVFARKNLAVFAGEFSIFRDQNNYVYSTSINQTTKLDLQLVARLGSKLSPTQLTAKVERSHWVKVDDPNYKYGNWKEEKESLPDMTAQSDSSGNAVFTFTPQKEGQYKFKVEGKDSRGNAISKDFYIWVSKDDVPQGQSGPVNLSVELDKEDYSLNDKPKLKIISTVPDRDVFLTFDRARVNRYQVVSLTGKSRQLEVNLESSDIPNIFAKASSFSKDYADTASQNIKVSTDPKRLKVSLTTDKKKYGPGETVTVNVETKDSNGNPTSGETAVWAVDKALFELVDLTNLDIFNEFWQERYDNTNSAHSLEGITISTAEQGGCFGEDTQILLADGSTKAIKDIVVGDEIKTHASENDATLVNAKVISTHSRDVTGYMIVNGTLKVTPNHKIYINGGWQEAYYLQNGDKLIGSDGKEVIVSSVEWVGGAKKVYNFDVEKYHTYIADGVWVHNQKGDGGGRGVFEDTAYWNPVVRTDSSGRATVRFTLPDNLTTWVVASIGSTQDTRVGSTTGEIVVTKDVIVRPILPNIMRTEDSMVISAIVQNFSEKSHEFNVNFDFNAGDIVSPKEQKFNLQNKEFVQVYWEIVPKVESDAELTFSALATDDKKLGDKVTIKLPVKQFGFWNRTAQNKIGPSNFELKLNPDSDLEKTKAILTLYPTLTGGLPSAMKYLIHYPYGCVEQTTSSFVPAVIAKENSVLFADALEGNDINDILDKGVKRLRTLQRADGGWTWWFSGDSDPFITAYVVEYLVRARNVGVNVPSDMLSSAKIYLESGKIYTGQGAIDFNRDQNVMRVYALSFLGSDKGRDKLTDFNGISADILSFAVLTNMRNGFTNKDDNGANLLVSLSSTEGDGVYWNAGTARWFGSADASTALAIKALTSAKSDQDIVSKGVRFLLKKRQYDYWTNTFATAQVIEAGVNYSKSYGDTAPNYQYDVKLDGKSITSGSVTNPNKQIKEISINVKDIGKGGSVVTVEKSGDQGQIYSTLKLEEFRTSRDAKAVENGLKISRKYVNAKGENYSLGVGDLVNVQLIVSGLSSRQNYAVIEDELPAGMIPVNQSFKNEQTSTPTYNYQFGLSDIDITQNGAILYIWDLGTGTQTFSYKARVISSGSFLTPPASVSLMYSPEINGTSKVQKITLDKESKLLPGEIVKDVAGKLLIVGGIVAGLGIVILALVKLNIIKAKSIQELLMNIKSRIVRIKPPKSGSTPGNES